MEKLRRLWRPRHPLFWMVLAFNALSSVCTWVLHTQPLNAIGALVVGFVALLNVGAGMLAAWRLLNLP